MIKVTIKISNKIKTSIKKLEFNSFMLKADDRTVEELLADATNEFESDGSVATERKVTGVMVV